MKKLKCLLLSLLLVGNFAFAKNFFNGRFFEVRADLPFGISNNVFALNDIMVKDLVIDFSKINDTVPDKTGLTTIIRLEPNVSTKLRIAGLSVGVNAGVDFYAKIGISKGLFEFLGNGYQLGDTFDISLVDPIVDVFAYIDAPVSLEVGKFVFGVTPSTFLPVIAMKDSETSATVVNDADGNIVVELKNNMNFYSTPVIGKQFAAMLGKDSGKKDGNEDSLSFNNMAKYLGFDIGASVGYKFNKRFDIRANLRLPIVPAKLDTNLNIKNSYKMEGNIMDMGLNGIKPTQTPFASETSVSTLSTPVKINRPLKFNAYADYKFLGFLDFTAGGGFGIRRPGGKEFYAYPEYYLAAGINFIDMLKLSLSTEYTDQLFIHALNGVVNLRVVEVDLGVSLEASSFAKSFTGAGLGGYIGLAIGF